MTRVSKVLSVAVVMVFATAYAAADITADTIAWWNFDETSGSAVYDSGPSGYVGRLENGTRRASGGVFGRALEFFNGSNYVRLQNFPVGDTFTISMWINPTGNGYGECFISKNTSAGNNIFIFGFWSAGYYVEIRSDSHRGGGFIKGWHHVAAVVEKLDATHSEVTVYRNGVPLWSHTLNDVMGDIVTGAGDWRLGMERDPGPGVIWDFYYGKMDDVRIYDGALSAGEVQELFDASPWHATVPTPPDEQPDVSVNQDLSWTAGQNASSHDVYLSTSSFPSTLAADNHPDVVYEPGILLGSTSYTWRVDENTSIGTVLGPIWEFSTTGTSLRFQIDPPDTGSVVFDPPGNGYPVDTPVTMTAVPNEGFVFDRWSGDLTGSTNPVILTMDSNKSVVAHFLFATDIIYVNDNATGQNTGTSWADAFTDLTAALDAGAYGKQIWVAEGTYKPGREFEAGDPRSAAFQMAPGAAIYGGFSDSGEPNMTDRDPTKFPTVLSGDIGASDDNTDNCYHVIYNPDGTNLDPNSILDGFMITGGHANSWQQDRYYGAGMYNANSSPTITRCTFADNEGDAGGGICNKNASPGISHCRFTENRGGIGGGIYNEQSTPQITDCFFARNVVGYRGGGLANEQQSNAIVTNCTFVGNSVTGAYGYEESGGGGMSNSESSPVVSFCHFRDNTTGGGGGGMWNFYNGSPQVDHCLFVANTGYVGGGMINVYDCATSIVNCTFSRNAATSWAGGGLCSFVNNATATIRNSIFRYNTAATEGDEIYAVASSPLTISYSDIAGCGGSGAGWDASFGTDGGGNIDADPLFADSDNLDFHLRSQPGRFNSSRPYRPAWVADDVTSPCIDAGDPADDVGNESAGNGGRVNMGYYGGTFQASRTSPPIEGDVNGDGKVDVADLAIVGRHWLEGN